MPKNIAAYTAEGSNYPQFVSINETGTPEGHVEIMVREGPRLSDATNDIICGQTISVVLNRKEWAGLLAQLSEYVVDKILSTIVEST